MAKCGAVRAPNGRLTSESCTLASGHHGMHSWDLRRHNGDATKHKPTTNSGALNTPWRKGIPGLGTPNAKLSKSELRKQREALREAMARTAEHYICDVECDATMTAAKRMEKLRKDATAYIKSCFGDDAEVAELAFEGRTLQVLVTKPVTHVKLNIVKGPITNGPVKA